MNRITIRLNAILWLAVALLVNLPAVTAHPQSAADAIDQAPPGPIRLLRFADILRENSTP
jgi:hypothetical protein